MNFTKLKYEEFNNTPETLLNQIKIYGVGVVPKVFTPEQCAIAIGLFLIHRGRCVLLLGCIYL